jgi:hypothetical protein
MSAEPLPIETDFGDPLLNDLRHCAGTKAIGAAICAEHRSDVYGSNPDLP